MRGAAIEREAAWLLRHAGYADDVPGGLRLARALGLEVVRLPRLVVPACLATIRGRPTIVLRAGQPPPEAHFSVCHEIAEHHLATAVGYSAPDIEERANELGAALLMPARAFGRAVELHGERWEQLALDFTASETAAALRHGETSRRPLAVVAPARARARGAWPHEPTEEELRRLARRPGPGLATSRLRDDRRRIVIVQR